MPNCAECGGYTFAAGGICYKCRAVTKVRFKKRGTPKLMADAPEHSDPVEHRYGCRKCEMVDICRNRMVTDPSAWVMCEIPDEMDLKSSTMSWVLVEFQSSV